MENYNAKLTMAAFCRQQNILHFALSFCTLIFLFSIPLMASAHEVYVLPTETVAESVSSAPFNMFATMTDNISQFVFWGFIAFVVPSTIFFISVFHFFEKRLDPVFARLKGFAPVVARVAAGLGFVAAGYHQAIFGPELPFAESFGSYAHLVSLIFVVAGTLIVVGFWARAAAALALVIFGISLYQHGLYMLTYVGYLGEIVVLLLIGSHRLSVHSLMGWHERFHSLYHIFTDRLKPLAFPILRICFGVSLIYSSLYAKVLHNNLALQVASLPLAGHESSLAYYFGFEPQFLVLGAAIIEIMIGSLFIFGIAIRWNSIFLLFWLMLSLMYFGETVWPHIILIGIPIAFIMHGYHKYSIEGYFLKHGRREPVL